MKAHRIADVFPLMTEEELSALVADIRKHGLLEAAWLFEGKILDGRNRAAACKLAGVKLRTREFEGTRLDALDFVWSKNCERRHLSSGQKAIANAKRMTMDAEFRAEEEAQKAEARERKAQAKGKPRGVKASVPQKIGEETDKHTRETSTRRAKAAGTNRRYLEMADELLDNAPELAEKVEKGELKITSAYQELKRKNKRRVLEEKAKEAAAENKGRRLWEICHGDCLKALASLRQGSARLVFADPPYNIGVDYGDGEDADRLSDSEYMRWVKRWVAACQGVLSDDGSLWVMIGDEYAAEYAVVLKEFGFTIRAWIKWYETFGVNCSNNFNRCSRHIFYAVCNPKQFVFNAEAVNRPSDRQVKYGDKRAASGGKIWDDVWIIPRLTGTCDERLPDFPTQYPVAIAEAIVGCASEPGDLVVDPFSGSATTGVAAVRLGRKYFGIEIRKRFAELSVLRLKGEKR